jgi:hypothetical protein
LETRTWRREFADKKCMEKDAKRMQMGTHHYLRFSTQAAKDFPLRCHRARHLQNNKWFPPLHKVVRVCPAGSILGKR